MVYHSLEDKKVMILVFLFMFLYVQQGEGEILIFWNILAARNVDQGESGRKSGFLGFLAFINIVSVSTI